MKKIIMVFLIMIVALGLSACTDTTVQKEHDGKANDNGTSVNINQTKYDKVRAYMEEECRDAFSPYYELLDFEISEYQEETVNGKVEATFFYKLIYKNYDKDPDTVEYIKEAKENDSKHYQQMYDEYLEPKEMNFELKVIMDEDDSITLYSNISPNGIEWDETKMTDYIIK